MPVRPLVRSVVSPLVRGVTQRGRGKYDPVMQLASIFSGGAKGAWYERSNAASLYQDSTGVTLGALGSPVGFGISREQGTARGPERVTNGTFSDGLNGFTATSNTTPTVVSGAIRLTLIAAGFAREWCAFATEAGKTYELTYNAVAKTFASNFVGVVGSTSGGLAGDLASTSLAAPGPGRCFFKAVGATSYFGFGSGSGQGAGTYGDFDNISVREVPGNHQSQATASFRPLYQATPTRLVFDGVDDVLTTTFATALGSNCTVGRAVPGTGAVITSGVNVGTNFADNVTAAALVIVDRALTSGETAALTAYLNLQVA